MMRKPADRPIAARRVRRTAEDARAAILDAAERQMQAGGPDALRLQRVAAEVGIAHPTVLHHFGSREGLVEAVVARALAALQADVVRAIAETSGGAEVGEGDVSLLLDRVAAALSDRGHGRAIAWLALSGRATTVMGGSGDLGFRAAAEATHAVRRSRRAAHRPLPPLEDTTFTLLLAFYVLFAQSVIGPLVAPSAGLAEGPRADARFRRWLARLVKSHLESGPE